ncbi:MAG: Tol-Pal system beta propeller repeat protein TolB [Candidatus Hydrogenedentes bacterium]|nr:Tol-Pal system beta propeller repeat protein TolB [Candidatus Hydrogenedentota bacterium]
MKRCHGWFCVLALCCLPALAQAVRINIEGVGDVRTPIVAPPFAVTDPAMSSVAKEMAEVITFDLEFSGLVRIMPPANYPPGFVALDPDVAKLDLNAWQMSSKAENLVFGVVSREGNQLVTQFRMFDLISKNQVLGQELRVELKHPRLAAHKFSEEIIRHINGTPGIGTSEIVFSAGETRHKEIYVADYDGANALQLTKHNSVSIKPEISPDGNKIAYLSYKDRYGFLYIFDRRSGQSVPLSKEVGLNSAPAWHPNGTQLVMTLSKDGNMEIYVRNADGSNPRRLTNNTFGDSSPVFSPDGQQIAFVSDRGGSPQIHVMGADGSNQRRVSLQGGNSFDPSWSPDGKFIAYVVEKKGQGAEIYVMDAGGGNPRPVTNSHGNNENPTWSADSRHVMFMSSRTGSHRLWAVNVATGEEKQIPRLNMLCEGPSWGGRRQ